MADHLPRLINCLAQHTARLVRIPGSTPGRALDDRSWRIPPRPRSGRRFATDAPPPAGAFGTEWNEDPPPHRSVCVRRTERHRHGVPASPGCVGRRTGQRCGDRVAAGAPPPWVVGASGLRARHGVRRSGSPHTGGAPTATLPPRQLPGRSAQPGASHPGHRAVGAGGGTQPDGHRSGELPMRA